MGKLISICVISNKKDIDDKLEQFLANLPKKNKHAYELILLENMQAENESLELIVSGENYIHLLYRYTEFDFSVARNLAKEYATGKWILSLDTDEIISEVYFIELLNILNTIGDNYNIKGLKFGIADNIFDPISKNITRMHHEQVKCFRNEIGIEHVGGIHELVEWTINEKEIIQVPITLEHHGYFIEIEDLKEKLLRNIRLLGKEIWKTKDNKELNSFYIEYLYNTANLLKQYNENIKK